MIDDLVCSLELDRERLIPIPASEPEDFVYKITGRVLCGTLHEERDRLAGRFRIYYADFSTGANYGYSAREVLDAYSDTYTYAEVLLARSDEPFSRRLEKLLGFEIWNPNFLVLDRVEILPQFRRRGIGLLAILSLMERFGAGAGVVGMKPFPLQFEPEPPGGYTAWRQRLQLDKLSRDHRQATKKLQTHYARLGFVRMARTPFMFRSESWRLPTASELMRPSAHEEP
jgi:GNAT superfamily N-acetyltransferase